MTKIRNLKAPLSSLGRGMGEGRFGLFEHCGSGFLWDLDIGI